MLWSALVLSAALSAPATGEVLLYEPSLIGLPATGEVPAYVRNQNPRGTCTMFSAVAAMEYAVWKSFGRVVDLSEQFVGHVGKSTYLHAYWEDLAPLGPYAVENQIASTAGGEYLGPCFDGLPMTEESFWIPYNVAPAWTPPLGDPYWLNQFNTNTFNTSRTELPHPVLNQPTYYQAIGFRNLFSGNDPAEVERVLDSGSPVSWDFRFMGDTTGEIWYPTPDVYPAEGHSMLIIGYNNTGIDDIKKFFWVKNSWGPTPYQYGLTKVSYAYYRQYGLLARTISGAVEVPSNYPYLGRWALSTNFDQRTLDITHIPGVSKQSWTYFGRPDQVDHRLGAIYDTDGTPSPETAAARVNGAFIPKGMAFYFTPSNPNQSYWALPKPDSRRGWLITGAFGDFAAGFAKAGTNIQAILANKFPIGTCTDAIVADATNMPGQYYMRAGKYAGFMQVERPTTPGPTAPMRITARFVPDDFVGTARFVNPSSLLTGGPFVVDKPMWVFELTRTTGTPFTVRLVGNKAVPGKMVFAGMSPSGSSFMARQITRLP